MTQLAHHALASKKIAPCRGRKQRLNLYWMVSLMRIRANHGSVHEQQQRPTPVIERLARADGLTIVRYECRTCMQLNAA